MSQVGRAEVAAPTAEAASLTQRVLAQPMLTVLQTMQMPEETVVGVGFAVFSY